jgi:hypothetical protein
VPQPSTKTKCVVCGETLGFGQEIGKGHLLLLLGVRGLWKKVCLQGCLHLCLCALHLCLRRRHRVGLLRVGMCLPGGIHTRLKLRGRGGGFEGEGCEGEGCETGGHEEEGIKEGENCEGL